MTTYVYDDGRHVLNETVMEHRLRFLTQLIRLLLTMVPDQRGQILREETEPYMACESTNNPVWTDLLANVPLQ